MRKRAEAEKTREEEEEKEEVRKEVEELEPMGRRDEKRGRGGGAVDGL